MYLRMLRHASRSDSSYHQLLDRVPRNVADRVKGRTIILELPASASDPAVTISFRLGTFAKCSLRTRDASTARTRKLAVRTHLSRVYEAATTGAVALSDKQTVALSGDVYRMLRRQHDENPGTPEQWAAWKSFTRAALEGRLWEAPPLPDAPRSEEQAAARAIFGDDLTAGVNELPRAYDEIALEQRCGRYALWVLQEHGIEVDRASHMKLLREVAKAALQAGWQLKRQADGDYRPDPLEDRFPPIRTATQTITFEGLFDRWRAETDPAPSTISTWRGIVASFTGFLGHDDPVRVTPENVVAWKDKLVAADRSTKTINDSDLACLRALYRYGLRNKILSNNPAEGIHLPVRQRAGERMLPYSDAEIARLLQIAERETHPARRWLIPLAVFTGARIGELAQAWGSQVEEIDGIPVLRIEPSEDGGTLKNEGSERIVPLHPALIEAGFLTFARSCGRRPMFYGRPARKGATSKHPSKGTSNHLAAWIREQGFTDPRKAPAHAVRHWFKSAARKAGMPDSMADAIQGHKDRTSAGGYRHFDDPKELATAMSRIRIQSA